ncbi:jg8479 [Pararge aegeria aegeria]|uniref:Jg8479 protein n=1 Tax=Pararge aegeria aegeria TaxID=348720 RepID=A0A8S4RXY4_9NEOP|nr:jg8479 [Pararge aegeria aegeria]
MNGEISVVSKANFSRGGYETPIASNGYMGYLILIYCILKYGSEAYTKSSEHTTLILEKSKISSSSDLLSYTSAKKKTILQSSSVVHTDYAPQHTKDDVKLLCCVVSSQWINA